MKFFCLAASHRPDSYNRKLIALATQTLTATGHSCDWAEYGEYDMLPYNDLARERGEVPPQVIELRERLLAVDGWLLATPEYNWSYPGSLKNIIDWLSHFRPVPFAGKTALLMCATPSRRGGVLALTHLRVPLEALGMYVYPDIFNISEAASAFDPSGVLTVPQAAAQLEQMLGRFAQFTQKLAAA